MTLFQLFLLFLKISSVTFGGGIVIIGMLRLEIADRGEVSEEEFSDMVSLAVSVPGPLAISIAWLLGRYYRGLKGSIVSVIGAVLPPFLIVLFLSPVILKYSADPAVQGFFKGVLAGTSAIITLAVFSNVKSTISAGWWNIVPFITVATLIGAFRINPLVSMLIVFFAQATVDYMAFK